MLVLQSQQLPRLHPSGASTQPGQQLFRPVQVQDSILVSVALHQLLHLLLGASTLPHLKLRWAAPLELDSTLGVELGQLRRPLSSEIPTQPRLQLLRLAQVTVSALAAVPLVQLLSRVCLEARVMVQRQVCPRAQLRDSVSALVELRQLLCLPCSETSTQLRQ